MCYREDYYKFAYNFLPQTVFNYGRLLNYRLLRDEELFVESLKNTWSVMELNKPELRANPPSFKLETINFNDVHTGIILTIPEAKEEKEAACIGITYDNNDSFRYFTYEIGGSKHDGTLYFLCETTADSDHYNYGFHTERDKDLFINDISDLLVYDLL